MIGAPSLRRRVHLLFEESPPSAMAARVRLLLALLILLNVIAVVLETVQGLQARWGAVLRDIETVSVTVFAIEYAFRWWAAIEQPAVAASRFGRLRWMVTPTAWIDLISILPSLLFFVQFDLRSLRMVRLARLLRLAKLGRYSIAMQSLLRVLRERAADMVSLLFVLVILLVISSTLMFRLEHEAQPNLFSSIPATMWWAIVTLTTIGYGDMVPITPAGRVLGGVIAVLGIGMFALPAGLLGAGFVEELGRLRAAHRGHRHGERDGGPEAAQPRCPHCGR
jgi:voltage-gated potassium channel